MIDCKNFFIQLCVVLMYNMDKILINIFIVNNLNGMLQMVKNLFDFSFLNVFCVSVFFKEMYIWVIEQLYIGQN